MTTKHRERWVALAAVVIVAIFSLALWELEIGPYLENGFLPGASGFSFDAPAVRIAPGSAGCRQISGDYCYKTSFETPYWKRVYGDLRLGVGSQISPQGPQIALGLGASVTVFGNSGPAGSWNLSTSSWDYGSGAGVPQEIPIQCVLDTGLANGTTLSNAWFWGVFEGQGSDVSLDGNQ